MTEEVGRWCPSTEPSERGGMRLNSGGGWIGRCRVCGSVATAYADGEPPSDEHWKLYRHEHPVHLRAIRCLLSHLSEPAA